VVNTSENFKDQYIIMEEFIDHSHGPEGVHSHSGTAFTTWIDFSQAAFQAKAVKEALLKYDIIKEVEKLNSNYNELLYELRTLDMNMYLMVKGRPNVPLVASHPVYQYLARRYGLNIKSLLWEPDVYPNEEMWGQLEKLLKEHPARWMIWEGNPLSETVERLKKLGMESIVFDPCGNRPEDGDFLSVMKQNIKNLSIIFNHKI